MIGRLRLRPIDSNHDCGWMRCESDTIDACLARVIEWLACFAWGVGWGGGAVKS